MNRLEPGKYNSGGLACVPVGTLVFKISGR